MGLIRLPEKQSNFESTWRSRATCLQLLQGLLALLHRRFQPGNAFQIFSVVALIAVTHLAAFIQGAACFV